MAVSLFEGCTILVSWIADLKGFAKHARSRAWPGMARRGPAWLGMAGQGWACIAPGWLARMAGLPGMAGASEAFPASKRRPCNTNVNSPYSKELIEDLDQLSRMG